MAYSELIKNFERIRTFMREFYVYGFKSRNEYTMKSPRSYDNEKRRIESWLGDYMKFRQTADGKNAFISIDSRASSHNPLYKAWKAKSFTDNDATLHFLIFDILYSPEVSLTLGEIMEKIDSRLEVFPAPKIFDESTIRKKLKEYINEGIIISEKKGKAMRYRREKSTTLRCADSLDFFSETAPCGVIGSFISEKLPSHKDIFSFKHHYITSAMDSDILLSLFLALSEQRKVDIEIISRRNGKVTKSCVTPLCVMISAQTGRQYIMAHSEKFVRISSYRIDNIRKVKLGEKNENFLELRTTFERMKQHLWGVSTESQNSKRMEHIDFTVRYDDDEQFIPRRINREKRCGTVEQIDKNTLRFSADVYDSWELMPWVRTFICRIVDINFSNKELEAHFKNDLQNMYNLYGLKGGERNDI